MPFPSGDLFRTVLVKTASYQVQTSDIGKILTNRGAAGAVTFTLPAVTSPTLPTGWWCEFFCIVDEDLVIASAGSNDNIVTINDATADSFSLGTTAEQIGNGARVVWDGTGWLLFPFTGETVTPTIA